MQCHENEHIQIDELKICYTATPENLHELTSIEIGSCLVLYGFKFCRTISDRFRYYFEVWENDKLVAWLKYGLYTDLSETKHFVYFKVSNHVLYRPNQLKTILEIPTKLGFAFHNFTAIDLAMDSNVNFTSLIKRMMRDKAITTIINGKAIKDRKKVLQGVGFQYSTTLDRLKHASITIKQKKAISNKRHGITMQAYDKKAEIEKTLLRLTARLKCRLDTLTRICTGSSPSSRVFSINTIRNGKADVLRLPPLLKSRSISFRLTMRSLLLSVGDAARPVIIYK